MLAFLIVAAISVPGDIYDPDAGGFLDGAPDTEELFLLADSAYRAGDYETSACYYLEGLAGEPWNSGCIYNLACCFGLLGRDTLAAVYLRRAWAAGFDDSEHLQWDPDFDEVRDRRIFSSLTDSLSDIAALRSEELGEEIVIEAAGPFRCRVKVPQDYDGSTPVPLVIGIHGLGGSPETFVGLWDTIEEYGCIFAVPQAPTPYLVGNRIGYSWYTGEDDEEWTASAVLSRDYVLTLLDRLEEIYSVSQVFLFGYSQGGGLTYMVGFRSPDRFTAIAPFSGWLEMSVVTEEQLEASTGLPVRIVHGEQDRVVGYTAALEADSVLSAMGFDVDLNTFQGQHMFSREALASFLGEFLGAP